LTRSLTTVRVARAVGIFSSPSEEERSVCSTDPELSRSF